MNRELTLRIGTTEYQIFLQDGFDGHTTSLVGLHNHHFAEVHLITNGDADFVVGERQFQLQSGHGLLIPCGVYHCCVERTPGAVHTAFQLNCERHDVAEAPIGDEILMQLQMAIASCGTSGNYTVVAAYLALIGSRLLLNEKLSAEPVTDRRFLIHEFLASHYQEELSLSDLAAFLHLSERQSERLVIEYTGKTFREELTAIRMAVAEKLLAKADMPKKEIAQYVGYQSYTGFWKAVKKAGICIDRQKGSGDVR